MAKKHAALWEQTLQAYARSQVLIDDNQSRYQDSWLYYRCIKPYNLCVSIDEQGRPVDKNGEFEKSTEYVAPILRSAVLSINPALVSTFTDDDAQAVFLRDYSFRTDPKLEETINQQLNQIILQKNDGYAIIEAAAHDALVSGEAFGKVFIEPNVSRQKIDVPTWEALDKMIGDAAKAGWELDFDTEELTSEAKGDTGAYQWRTVNADVQDPDTGDVVGQQPTIQLKGKIPLIRNDKELLIEVIGLKDLAIDTSCGSEWNKLRYICHKRTTTVGDAINMGFKKKDLETASTLSEITDTPYSKRELISGNQISTDEDWHNTEGSDPLERPIRLYEHYIYSSKPSGKTKLYQVIGTDCEMLDYNEVSFIPFIHGQMKPVSDSFYGESLYDYCWHFQDMISDNMRVAKQNVIDSTYQKTIAVEGKYDRASLLRSHQTGAIIEVKDNPAYVQPYTHVDLPRSYDVLNAQLDAQRNELVGSLIGNMATDEGMPSNIAASTVAQILSQEGLKTKTIAKAFARSFVKPLYELVYKTLVAEGITIQMEDGQQINSADFPSVYEFAVDINTPNDTTAKNAQLAAVLNMFSQVQPNSLANAQSIFKVGDEMLKQVGLRAKDFFVDPETAQPDPNQQQMMEVQKEGALLNVQAVAADVAKKTAEAAKIEAETQLLIQDKAVDREVKLQESAAKITGNQNKHDMDAAKLASANKIAIAKTALDAGKLKLDTQAVAAEIAHKDKDITLKHIQHQTKMFNGVEV